MRGAVVLAATALSLAAAASAQQLPVLADTRAIAAKVEAMRKALKPGQGFAMQPLVADGEHAASLEYWTKPGKPALHPDEAEYAIVVAGRGTLLYGGTLAEATVTRPGLTEGARIEGGMRRALAPGDVMLIPAGMPHWFGIDGERLVLLGTKLRSKR